MPLPVTAEIDGRRRGQRQPDRVANLIAIADAPVVFTKRCLLGVAHEVRPGDMMMRPDFATPHAREEQLGTIAVNASHTVSLTVVDAAQVIAGLQIVPRRGFVRHNLGARRDARGNPTQSGRTLT